LVESRIQVRPALAFAAALALVIASVAITSLIRAPGAPTVARPTVGGGGEAGTVLVRFELHAPEARDVALAGSFNGWSETSTVFVPSPESGLWTVTLALPPGEYVYLFVVDGERWVPDPRAHAQVEDEFGQTNSVLVVGPRGVVRS
jgi:1,4-alpha-glucan branching enzyme